MNESFVKARQFLTGAGIKFNPILERWRNGENIPLYRCGRMMYLIPSEFFNWMKNPNNHSHIRNVKKGEQ